MNDNSEISIEESRIKLLKVVEGASDITFIRGWGNIGDHLIYAGTRQLLASLRYSEVSIRDLQGVTGDTALMAGSGAWCGPFHNLPKFLPLIERRFRRVIVLPSSFDVSVRCVRDTLSATKAKVFARERESFRQIKDLCDADLAHDCAFFFDYSPYKRPGSGVLTAYRQDQEAAGYDVPPGNNDLSATCESLDEWLWTIARHELIRTDRAHVMLASALLGKRVEFRSSSYHKVPAIAEFCLKGFPIFRSTDTLPPSCNKKLQPQTQIRPLPRVNEQIVWKSPHDWNERLRRTAGEISALFVPDNRFIIVDEDQVRPLLVDSTRATPFLERDGQYWGPPFDDAAAIRELEWLRTNGAVAIVIAWPAFWWLNYYTGFHRHLRANFRCLSENEEFIVFQILEHPSLAQSAYP